MTTETKNLETLGKLAADTDTLGILAELAEEGITPGEELERVVETVGGDVVHKGDEDTGPAVMTDTTGAGITKMYHTETGLDSKVSKNMLPAKLREKLPSGKRAFTIYPPFTPGGPTTQPVEGTIKCYMHKDSEMRSICGEFGFVLCVKDNISSVFDLETHMVKRHTQEWRSFERRRIQTETDETREISRGMLAATRKMAGITVAEPEVAAEPETASFTRTCPKSGCDVIITADTQEALRAKMGGHTRKAHPKQKRK